MHNDKNYYDSQKSNKILFLFLLFLITFIIFTFSILRTIFSDRDLPSQTAIIHDRSLRGAIISQDGFTIAQSQKNYQANIRAESINPENKELFVTLFSLYSDIPKQEVKKKFKNGYGYEIKQGNIILSKNIDARHAAQLKSLAHKLRKLNILRPTKKPKGVEIVYGLDIIESGETRLFPFGNTISPVLGFVGKRSEKDYIRPIGKQGLERRYDKYIGYKNNGYIEGKRDVIGDVIHNQYTDIKPCINGLDLHLTIPLKLQRNVEYMLDDMKKETNAEEIIATVMDSKTGQIITMSSSNRFDPNSIKKQDISSLNPKFSEYLYEPGSVLKPFTLAIALDYKRVTPQTVFNLFNGELDIGGKRKITDGEHRFSDLSASDIIVHSSNVGISLISWLLTGDEFRDGLLKFGLSRPTGIDLSRDLAGTIKPVYLLNRKLYRANSAYGYGLMVSFMQLLKAYASFNNNGIMPTPHLIDYFEDTDGNKYKLPSVSNKTQVISSATANQMNQILIQTVINGTGEAAITPGITVGGKTGTAKMTTSGKYVDNKYQTSFFGFANDDKGHRYTIGVLVINPNRPFPYYYAAMTAVPVAKKIVDMLIVLKYLEPNKQQVLLFKQTHPSVIEENIPQSIIDESPSNKIPSGQPLETKYETPQLEENQ
ncbi:MAG: penicillin-binding protein 2 [Sulfurovaceae bacterium]|nr:penicillin-binding protein 2 [Sulfurovaceae bacterium]